VTKTEKKHQIGRKQVSKEIKGTSQARPAKTPKKQSSGGNERVIKEAERKMRGGRHP